METNYSTVYELDPKTLCRICLAQNGILTNIFSQLIVDRYLVALPEIISYTLDISVDRGDNLPQKICDDCKKQVVHFYTFKEKSKRTEKSMQDVLQPNVDVKIESVVDSIEDDDADAFICSVCDKRFKTNEEFYQHSMYDHDQEEQDIDIDFEAEHEIDDSELPEQTDEMLFHVGYEDDSNYVVIPSSSAAKKYKGQAESTTQLSPVAKRAIKEARDNPILIETTNDDSEILDSFDDELSLAVVDDEDDGDSNSMSIDQFQCILCLKSFTDRNKYITHCRSHDFNCAHCNRVFPDAELLAAHEVIHESVKSKRSYGEFIRDDMFCIPCNKRLKSSSQVEQHYKMHDAISMVVNYMDFYPCHECQIIHTNEEKLTAHIEELHPGSSSKTSSGKVSQPLRIMDDGDDESYVDYQFLEDDRDSNDYKEGQYVCGECDIIYLSARDCKNHAVLHQTKFKCPIHGCGCQYDQLSRLSIHIFHKHINSANLQCLHCQESFETYDKLQAHMKGECKEKKYKCHHCDKKFFSKKALLTHLKTLKEKKYSCNFCGKTFKQQGELTIHTRSHTNERPFQCTICEKSYKTSSMRAAHMDSHITGKTFECELCQKKLQSRTSYRNHMKRHTEEKKHVCECGKRFFTKYHLRLHYSKIHERKDSGIKEEYILDD